MCSKRAVMVMGPTASGKTDLVLNWARKEPGSYEIVCVDSVTIYKGLNIGSAKPTDEERAIAPHHLLDIKDPWDSYSVAEFLADARETVEEIWCRGRTPILVGGTPLYFYTLLNGLSPLPASVPEVRDWISSALKLRGGLNILGSLLSKLDEGSYNRLHPMDKNRVMRAIEVFLLTGSTMSELQAHERVGGIKDWGGDVDVTKFVIIPAGLDEMRAPIKERLYRMIDSGLLGEVEFLSESLKSSGRTFPALNSVVYKQLLPHYSDCRPLNLCIEDAAQATILLAKRQITWFKKLTEDAVSLGIDEVGAVKNGSLLQLLARSNNKGN